MPKSILIVGGGGMIGQKVAWQIHNTDTGSEEAPKVTLFDVAFPERGAPCKQRVVGSVNDRRMIERLIEGRPEIILYLASIVSGEAELDFGKGWRTNMMAMWHFLEALREANEKSKNSYRPKLIFTSSVAVFGSPFPQDAIDDEFHCTPHSSYGSQKVACEMLVNDFSRKGFIDGISLRLPTITVRPGEANKAATSFFSGIIREPLNGKIGILPVLPSVRHAHASPRSAAGFVTHAMSLDTNLLHGVTAINMPCISCTVEEQVEALRSVAGNDAASMVRYEHNDLIAGLVHRWPQRFETRRANKLGFEAERDFNSIVQIYLEDDLVKGEQI